jgi:hypothetical protein
MRWVLMALVCSGPAGVSCKRAPIDTFAFKSHCMAMGLMLSPEAEFTCEPIKVPLPRPRPKAVEVK